MEAVRGGVTRDALVSFRHLIVPGDCCPHLAGPNCRRYGVSPSLVNSAAPGNLSSDCCLKNSMASALTCWWAQFGVPPLPMDESQPLAVEICNDCGCEFLRARTSEFEASAEIR